MTPYGDGARWRRSGLDRKTRSIRNLIMLVACNRRNEFDLDLGGPLANGVGKAEVQGIPIQGASCRGAPAAVSAFKDASEVLASEPAG